MNTLQQAAAAMEDGSLDTQKLVRILPESALNAIMDEQADMACEGGASSRNGYRERGLLTPAGKITLRIPKLRCGTYFPDGILERYGRVDKAVAAAVAEMYATGVSTRKVERIAAKLGIERLSASQVSRICERLDAEVAELRSREFSVPMPYMFLDATYVKCRRDNRVQSTAVVTAIAVGADGVRRVVGLSAIDTETYAGWLGFCRDLRKRGVSGVRCVTSDAHEGLRRAIAECSPARRGSAASCIWSATRARCSGRSATAGRLAGSCRRCSRNPSRPRCERPTTRRSTRSRASPERRRNCSRRPRPTRWKGRRRPSRRSTPRRACAPRGWCWSPWSRPAWPRGPPSRAMIRAF